MKKNKSKLKKILFQLSSPDERQELLFKENKKYSKVFSKEIDQIKKAVWNHEQSRQELVNALNILDDKHEAVKKSHGAQISGFDQKVANVMYSFASFRTKNEEAVNDIRNTIKYINEKHKGFKGESEKSLEKLKKELLKEIDTVVQQIESMGKKGMSAGNSGPIGVGGSRTTFLNGQNISPFDLYSDVNWIPGPGITISAVNNTTTWQVDTTISATGSSGGGGYTYNEIPSGTIDGINTDFTLAHIPSQPALMLVTLGGGVATQLGGSPDYSVSSSTITFTSAPVSGTFIMVYYS